MTKEAMRKEIGARIRDERLARNMSTDELAKLLSLSPGFIGLIESGRRGVTLYNIYRLANVFDIPISDFFPGVDNKRSKKAETSLLNSRRAKLASLVSDLDETELSHVINAIKELKALLSYARKEK